MSNNEYTYAVARIRARETKLLDGGKISRMAEAADAAEALKVLGETEYAVHVAAVTGVHHFEEIIAAERRRLYPELRQMLPRPDLINLFAEEFDYHNLKVLLKAQHLPESQEHLLEPDLGNLPLADLLTAVSTADFSQLPPRFGAAAVPLLENFQPQQVDLQLDWALAAAQAEAAQGLSSPWLGTYFRYLRDLTNVKTFLRVRRLQRSPDFLASALLPPGEVDLQEVLTLSEPLENVAAHLAQAPYAAVIDEGLADYLQTGTLTRYEKLADNFLLAHLRQAKHYITGPEPVAAYLLAKENELKLIRLIMAGKISRLPVAAIRERLRDVYV